MGCTELNKHSAFVGVVMEQDLANFTTLQHIVARLRAPDGCPWDREQTHSSIKPYLMEEAYEVLEALDEGDMGKLCEELGDLLMQILLHAQIASEAGEFEMRDIVRGIAEKLIRRHPHVFGDVTVANAREVLVNWEELKRSEHDGESSLLARVPRGMPALAYSQAIQDRAARVGFDWKEFGGILEKLIEELAELKEAKTQQQRVREFGDLLFALANAARWLEVDPEGALRQANERFYHRFTYIEEACRRRGVQLSSLSFDEQNALWEEAKRQLKD